MAPPPGKAKPAVLDDVKDPDLEESHINLVTYLIILLRFDSNFECMVLIGSKEVCS